MNDFKKVDGSTIETAASKGPNDYDRISPDYSTD